MKERALAMPPLHPMLAMAFVNFILVLFLLVAFFSFFATPSGYEVRMPILGASSVYGENHSVIRITSENVLYFDEKVVTMSELKKILAKTNGLSTDIYLRIDRRASSGRVADVWELCKGLGVARVKIVVSPGRD